jgi:F-type H+-transporting ATPase subunit gamma
MSSLIGIRRRIRSTKNIAQITKAMQMVSASKMRRAQDAALATRPFTNKLREILARVTQKATGVTPHGLTIERPENRILIALVSTNKGLCGGLNVNLHRGYAAFVAEHPSAEISVATVGKKGRYVIVGRDVRLAARFDDLHEYPSFAETRTIAEFAMDSFLGGQFDAVYLAYPKFLTTLTSEVTVQKLLPVSALPGSTDSAITEYKIEPDPESLLEKLLPYQVEMSVHQSILEARATEHSARMVAMKNASDNARDLIGSLTLDYNSARQSQVTSELLDVTTARMALE